ncbi:MAG: autotransporter domain-containing protein [Verrucomicrobiota bacterium]
MKRLFIRRSLILRAIHAACLALVLAALTQRASAQSLTAPFVVNGTTVSTNQTGTFISPVGFYDATNTYSTLSVGSGVTINSTAGFGGNFQLTYQTEIDATTASFANQGNLSLNTNSGSYQATVGLNQGATSVSVVNSGSIVSSGNGTLNVSTALGIVSTSGNIAVDNKGLMSASGAYAVNTLSTQSTSGNITITNEASGQITNGSAGFDVFAQTAGNGAIAITNDGVLNAQQEGIAAFGDAGPLSITNSGTVNVANGYGILGTTNSGPITIINNGAITGTNSNYGILASNSLPNSGAVSVTNAGTISGVSNGIGAYQSGTAPLTITNSGSITSSSSGIYGSSQGTASSFYVRNTGKIISSSSGIYLFSPARIYNTGSIVAPTAISVPSGSSVTLAGNPVITGTIVGGATALSASRLTFALTIPATNFAAAKTQLNADIGAYQAQAGGNMTFVINGLTYDISNFDPAIIDALVQASSPVPPVPPPVYADTPGYHSIGLVVDNLNPNDSRAAAILDALGKLPASDLPAALAELSPAELDVFRNVAFDNNTFNVSQLNNHLANLRDNLTGFDSSALTVQDPSLDPSLSQIQSHLLAYSPPLPGGLISDSTESMFGGIDTKDMKSTAFNATPTDRWSSFIAGNVILADLSTNANVADSNYTTGAVTAGVDYRLDEHFTVGALFAYAHTDATLDNRGSSATVDSYSPGLYASYVDGGWYGNGLATYGRNAYSEDRMVDIPGISGDNHGGTSGNQGTASFTGGYEFHQNAFKFGPVASLQYVHLSIYSLQEQGPTSLAIDGQNQDSLRSLLGFEGRFVANVNSPVGPLSLNPHVSASWQHEYMNDSSGITSQFNGAAGGSFFTQTENTDRDSAFVDVGLDVTVCKNITVFVDYETQVGQSNFFAQSAQGGVRIGF